ncbi:MAG: FAD binding domain-containing protein [Tractidigestivibacter sp.]|jgi:CO/xanthine dehydrogenase FAD-binding subunit|uniref:FAD binding domain-containing protein n=1 Tax=Tractidigestivibacter sp. TaxID=2847320 RepID=UPI003D8B2B6B
MMVAGYARPSSLEEALSLLANPATIVLAGGTDVMVKGRTRSLYGNRILVDVTRAAEMRGIFAHDGLLDIGAAEPLSSLAESDMVRRLSPVLWKAVRSIGGVQTRNRATLGGNLANACPAADGICACVALGAKVVLAGQSGHRCVPVAELFKPCAACLTHEGMLVRTCLFADPREKKTVMEAGELIVRVLIPERAPREVGAYVRLSANEGIGLADVNACAVAQLDESGTVCEARACVGGVLPQPHALEGPELPLVGSPICEDGIRRCADAFGALMDAECKRLANGAYKRRVAPVVLADALRALGPAGEDVPNVPGLRRMPVSGGEDMV